MSAKHCPAYWTSEPPCPETPEGSDGKHRCGMVSDHTTCRCACGSTHKRPVDHAARFEARQGQGRASLSLDGAGGGRVSVMGVDISNAVGGGTLEFEAGGGTVLRVAMPLVAAFARGEIELDDATAGALLAIGWLSPEQAAEERRLEDAALANVAAALGSYAPDEVTWFTLVEAIGELAGRMEGLDK